VGRGRWTNSLLFILLAASSAWAQAQVQDRGIAMVVRLETQWNGHDLRLDRAWLQFRPTNSAAHARCRVDRNGEGGVRLTRGVRYSVRVQRLRVVLGTRQFMIDPRVFTLSAAEMTVPSVGPIPEPVFRLSLRKGEHRLRVRVQTKAGVPIAGARVLVAWYGSKLGMPYGVFKTDMAGQFKLPNLLQGRTILTVVDSGTFALANLRDRRGGRSRAFHGPLAD